MATCKLQVQQFLLLEGEKCAFPELVCPSSYVLDIQCRPEGFVTVRDGAYSKFDKTKAVEDFTPIQGLRVSVLVVDVLGYR